MDEYKQIPIGDIVESKTNTRTFNAAELKQLTASIKEKGILQPLIVRPLGKKYELVAGGRRLRAAKAAGLKTVPTSVRDLSDAEAQEVQIVENLQREDIHPIDEAHAYKALITEVKDIAAVAAKVGKSETYVRARLQLENLAKEVVAAARSGEVNEGHASEIAKLSPAGDQQKALTYIKTQISHGYVVTVNDLKKWIEGEFNTHLAFQPWLKNADAMAAVGPCKQCPPTTSTLFGDVAEGACTLVRCWRRKLEKYIAWKKTTSPDLLLVSTNYGLGQIDGVIGRNSFDKVPKGSCSNAKEALVVVGDRRGSTMTVCIGYCKKHRPHREKAVAAMTPAEKEKREKEKAKEEAKVKAREEQESKELDASLAKISWPPSDKALDVLFEGILNVGDDLDDVVKRRGIAAKHDDDGDVLDGSEALRKVWSTMPPLERFRLLVEMSLDLGWGGDARKVLKKL